MLLRAGKTNLPAPTSMTVNDEIIWSEDTGRTLNGTMVGEAIAEKQPGNWFLSTYVPRCGKGSYLDNVPRYTVQGACRGNLRCVLL